MGDNCVGINMYVISRCYGIFKFILSKKEKATKGKLFCELPQMQQKS
jgi:hypothetical protein